MTERYNRTQNQRMKVMCEVIKISGILQKIIKDSKNCKSRIIEVNKKNQKIFKYESPDL